MFLVHKGAKSPPFFGFVNDFPLRCDMVFWIDAVFGYVYNTKTHMHKRVENFVTYKGFVWPHLCVILSLVDEKWQGSESLYVCAIILYLNFGFLSRIRYFIFTFSSEAYKWLQFNILLCVYWCVTKKERRKNRWKKDFVFTFGCSWDSLYHGVYTSLYDCTFNL